MILSCESVNHRYDDFTFALCDLLAILFELLCTGLKGGVRHRYLLSRQRRCNLNFVVNLCKLVCECYAEINTVRWCASSIFIIETKEMVGM